MNNYSLNGRPLSDFGIVPVRNSSAGNLALAGAWNLPKRTGDTSYDWQDGDGVEPYTDAEEIAFAGREITWSGLCRGNSSADLASKLDAFREFIGGLPAGTVELDCKWGTWQVRMSKTAEITIIGDGKRDAQIRLAFHEPVANLAGAILPAEEEHQGGVDGYSWRSLGLGVTLTDGRYDTTTWKELKTTADVFVRGGRAKREITFKGYLMAPGYEEFIQRLKVLYSLFGGPGVRHIVSMGMSFDGFCTDGFNISGIRVKPGITLALFDVKITVISPLAY